MAIKRCQSLRRSSSTNQRNDGIWRCRVGDYSALWQRPRILVIPTACREILFGVISILTFMRSIDVVSNVGLFSMYWDACRTFDKIGLVHNLCFRGSKRLRWVNARMTGPFVAWKDDNSGTMFVTSTPMQCMSQSSCAFSHGCGTHVYACSHCRITI